MIVDILEILTRTGVIEPIMLTTVFSTFIHGFFRYQSKRIELKRIKIELLKNQSEMEVKQRLESLEEIITRIGYDIERIDQSADTIAKEKKIAQETVQG